MSFFSGWYQSFVIVLYPPRADFAEILESYDLLLFLVAGVLTDSKQLFIVTERVFCDIVRAKVSRFASVTSALLAFLAWYLLLLIFCTSSSMFSVEKFSN